MRYLSVCSGIEAATVAWQPLGWQAAAFAEIETHPSAVLAHHYPDVPNHGDFTTIKSDEYGTINLIVGGTPCQSFSVAGGRKGLDDQRGNLSIEYCKLIDRIRPTWIVWENVPGVLSLDDGKAFGIIIGQMAECGYSLAWRILDAQYVRVQSHPRAVPQRRRRVFVIGYFGDWRPPAAVLFESQSLCRNTPPGRKTRKNIANTLKNSLGAGSYNRPNLVVNAPVASTLDASFAKLHGHDNQHIKGGATMFVSYKTLPLDNQLGSKECRINPKYESPAYALRTDSPMLAIKKDMQAWRIRKFTPIECERLQGFPDNYTAVPYKGKPMADSPRYRMIGNSMAVNVMSWIGERIKLFEELTSEG